MIKFKIALIFLVGLLSFKGGASVTFDLTDPVNLEIADMYPQFKKIRILSFKDTIGSKELGDGNESYFGYIENDTTNYNFFRVSISSSNSGKQRIYIYLAKSCKNADEKVNTVVVKTNGTNVKYHQYCDGYNYYLGPISTAGLNYLVSEFKIKDNVLFEFNDINVLFSAEGFTKSWKKYGGDAL